MSPNVLVLSVPRQHLQPMLLARPVGAGLGAAGGSPPGGMREEGVYLQPGFIQNPATCEHFLPPLRFLPGPVSLWFSWGGRKEDETASCFWG